MKETKNERSESETLSQHQLNNMKTSCEKDHKISLNNQTNTLNCATNRKIQTAISKSSVDQKKSISLSPDVKKQIEKKLEQLSEPDFGKWEVRLTDVLKNKPKTKKNLENYKENLVDNDDVIELETKTTEFRYCPLSQNIKQKLQTRTTGTSGVACNNTDNEPTTNEQLLGMPQETRPIMSDGNCFVRALSFAVFDDECHHFMLRSVTVNHLLKNERLFRSFLRSGYFSMSNYVLKKGMLKNGTLFLLVRFEY